MRRKIGIIGGSGLERAEILEHVRSVQVETPWGETSAPVLEGDIAGVSVAFMSRHGAEHALPPSQVNYRANIHALKSVGCTHILATTAVGSLRKEICRGDFVVLDQFIDFTHKRKNTFFEIFELGQNGHTSMADPFDASLREILCQSCEALNLPFHARGTVVTIEGPRFSTRAESRMFQSWGGDVINMSVATEVELANEAGIPYAAVGMSTDYDVWHADEEPVTWEAILEVFSRNVQHMNALLVKAVVAAGQADLAS